MRLRDFVNQKRFSAGEYQVRALSSPDTILLCKFAIDADDEDGSRHVPTLSFPDDLSQQHKRLVFSAVVRAGARHPGIRVEDLARLHGDALQEGQIELFSDLNALTTGLLMHLIKTLGRKAARVIVSSSSIDVLHEYVSHYSVENRLGRAEMVRALRVLDEVRRTMPVHIHQLAPGAARYFSRVNAQPDSTTVDESTKGEPLFISEDRQMMSAFWDYQTRSNPRLPVILATSDFSLANVCAAERARFVFAQTPFEFWRRRETPAQFDLLWLDPFTLELRSCIPHLFLWELSLIFGGVSISTSLPDTFDGITLSYDQRDQRPGYPEEVTVDFDPKPRTASTASPDVEAPTSKGVPPQSKDRRIKLSLTPIIEVLPTRRGQDIPLQLFRARDEDSLRQLRQLGQATDLYRVEADEVVPGPSLDSLLSNLDQFDYVGVNDIFRRHPTYDKVLIQAEEHGYFPSSKVVGAATGWAIMLGAAYKTKNGVLYGLAKVSDDKFEQTVVRFHGEVGDGQPAAPLPKILDRTCLALRLSPIRFESLLARSLGRGALARFEVQRASVDFDLPAHPVLVSPTSALSESYIRQIEPGRGILVKQVLVSSLVRRSGRA